MTLAMDNLFEHPHLFSPDGEFVQTLHASAGALIERILSQGHRTPEGEWYDQPRDEWVALLQGEAELLFEDGERVHMERGDWMVIPASRRHRVERTSTEPVCVWLAIHISLSGEPSDAGLGGTPGRADP